MTHLEFSIHCNPENQQAHDIIVAYLMHIGFDRFEEREGAVQAYINRDVFTWEDFKEAVSQLKTCGIDIKYKYHEADDQNWNEEWEKNFVPVIIGSRLLVRAPFHSSENDLPLTLVIEPKMSFGTGHHQTTRLMLQAMMQIDMEGKKVLDMGCGTGILGIYASKKGAESVTGIDIDNWAYENAIENISRNKVSNMSVRLGDVCAIEEGEMFDIIVANINRNVLLKDIPVYVGHLRKRGILLLSGFLSEDAQYVLDCAYAHNLLHTSTVEEAGWLILSFVCTEHVNPGS